MSTFRSLVVLTAFSASVASAQSGSAPRRTIDWPAFLSRHDLVWPRLPEKWGESAFIGNGNLGATIFSQEGVLGWTINRTDVTHDQSRYPIGRVTLKTKGAQRKGTARLTLWDAEASGDVSTDSGTVHWRSYAVESPSVIVIELTGQGAESGVDLGWTPAEARPPRKVARKDPFAPEDLHPAPTIETTTRGITSVQPFIGGDAHAEWIRRGPSSNGRKVFYVAIGNGKDGAAALRDATQDVDRASSMGEARLTAANRAWWHAYYPSSFVSFPDPRLEGYYWIQIYKLGSAMRATGPILDLNGPWYNATPWPAIWWNLNIQLTYSPLFRANRIPLSESLIRNVDAGTPALIANVPERLRSSAAAIGRSSGPDLVRKVDLATATSDAAHEMGDLPWTMFYYWEYYRYTMDDRLLRTRVYPLLGRAIGNYLGYVEKGADGKYHLPKTHSPELTTVPDANFDLALLRWGLQSLIWSAEHLKIDDPRLPQWRDVLANLTPPPQDSTGLLVGRDRPWKESHRHYSHLLSIYPLGLLTPDSANGRTLIERSLATWEGVPALFRGYSYTGGASMHAMLGEGDAALERMNKYLDAPRYMEPNTFYAEAGPVIETPLSAATTMQELFLQDWGGAMRVFNAIPTSWKEASFDKLRADGAFLVSGVRASGHTAWVRIESLAGQPARLVVPDWQTAVVRAGSSRGARVRTDSAGHFTLDIPRGGAIVLAPDARSPLPPLAPVPIAPEQEHRWPALVVVDRPSSTPRPTGPERTQDRADMAWWRESMQTRESRIQWWRDARFGMFIHWGAYSQLGGMWNGEPVKGYAEHIQRIKQIPAAAYRAKAVEQFNPTRFDADEWVRTAKNAGMGYMIITAKHHDGFAMWDSKVSDYNIVNASPFHRDPMRELRDAAKRQGLKFGFYYSHAFDWGDADAPGNDWEYDNPGGDKQLHGGANWWEKEPARLAQVKRYVDRKAIPQIRELIKNYDPDIMWFDTPHKLPPEENLRILRAAREAKPTLVINGRAVQTVPDGPPARFGDYASTADRPAELVTYEGDWEAIPTTNESYGYHQMDRSHKPAMHFVQLLAKAAARGGNLLLNIGPRGDGTFDPADRAILDSIGRWMAVNGESIRGTQRTPLPVQLWGQSTYKGNKLYLHVFDWPKDGVLRVAGVKSPVFGARLLAKPGTAPLTVTRLDDADVAIAVPREAPDPWDSVIALDTGVPFDADRAIWLRASGAPLRLHVFDGTLSGSGIRYGDGKRGHDAIETWSDTAGKVSWTVRLTEPARYRVALDYAAVPADSGGVYTVAIGAVRASGVVQPTGSATTFTAHDVGTAALGAGTYTITVVPSHLAGAELMRLRALDLIPVGSAQ